ncbi:molecular chaperone [Saccharomonospora marina XMU15]|uniref:Molecular chaperone n=1 Tax=Saccharomonospora marina XMU15 TaxID=882083 RepID=H5X8D3_9PSEU|nr:Hsp70 family protein [Saccharomonospora marina]EHR50229.1 molecular chaperone [Saccharomonospora marina XMU15]
MNKPLAYGIDFGTTNTLLSVARTDTVDLLAVDGESELLRSLIYLHRKPLRSAGANAVREYVLTAGNRTRCGACSLVHHSPGGPPMTECKAYTRGSGCFDSRLISEIKRALTDVDRDRTHSWARDFDYPDLISTIFRTLKRRADRAVGANIQRVVVGHPVAFEGATGGHFSELQRLAKARIRMAAQRAGFTDVEMLEEPSAATLLEADEGTVLTADFGGGTFDVAVIELTATTGVVRALSGANVGGADLDGIVFKHALFPALGLDDTGRRGLPNRYRYYFSRRDRAVRTLSDADLAPILSELQRDGGFQGIGSLRTLIANGWINELYDAAEAAKCALSTAPATQIRFDKPGVDIRVEVTRKQFEGWITREIGAVRETISTALAQAGLTPEQVDLAACTGGSSQIPAFRRVLTDIFGEQKIQQREPYSAIALGLGLHARRLWHG